jgi:predicted HTH transcriptional regulator
MNIENIIDIIQNSKESRFIEFKKSCPFKSIQGKLIKTIIAMSNLEDGGLIVVGIEETNGTYYRNGINESDLKSYQRDEILSQVNSFAEPHINIDLHTINFDSRNFLIIQVFSFSNIPTICIKDGADNLLRKGGIYIRSARIPESTEIRTYSEMRELIDLATQRSVIDFINKLNKIGLSPDKISLNSNKYNEELNGL